MPLTKIQSLGITDGTIVNADINASAAIVSTKLSGVANTPAFAAYMSADQSVANATEVKAVINTEVIDTDGCYDPTTNYRFTPTTAGKYLIGATTRHSNWTANRAFIAVKINGAVQSNGFSMETGNSGPYEDHGWSKVITFNGTTDYAECWFYQDNGTSKSFQGENYGTYFWGYRLIGV